MEKALTMTTVQTMAKHNDEDKDNKDEDKNQKRHRHPSTSWMRRLVSIKKNIGTHKDKLQEKVKHSDKEKDKKSQNCLAQRPLSLFESSL